MNFLDTYMEWKSVLKSFWLKKFNRNLQKKGRSLKLSLFCAALLSRFSWDKNWETSKWEREREWKCMRERAVVRKWESGRELEEPHLFRSWAAGRTTYRSVWSGRSKRKSVRATRAKLKECRSRSFPEFRAAQNQNRVVKLKYKKIVFLRWSTFCFKEATVK